MILGKGARGKTLLWGALGAILGAALSHVPDQIWQFIAANSGAIASWGSGIVALIYTAYQEFREHKRHGSISIPQVPKCDETTGDKIK